MSWTWDIEVVLAFIGIWCAFSLSFRKDLILKGKILVAAQIKKFVKFMSLELEVCLCSTMVVIQAQLSWFHQVKTAQESDHGF